MYVMERADYSADVGLEWISMEAMSFERFYASQYSSVVRLCIAVTGRPEVAEEVAQEAFVAAHRRWEQVSGFDSPEAWVRRAALNAAVSVLRRRRTELRLLGRLAFRRDRPPSAVQGEWRDMWKAVAALPRRQAQVVALIYLEDRSAADTARVLGLTENTVRTHLRRALEALSEPLRGWKDDDGSR